MKIVSRGRKTVEDEVDIILPDEHPIDLEVLDRTTRGVVVDGDDEGHEEHFLREGNL